MLSAISCKDENKYPKEDSNCNACGVSAPQRNIEWLVKKIAECKVSTDKTKHFFHVYVFEYKGRELFLFSYGAKSLADPHDAYDCLGNLISMTEQMHMELRENRNKWICIYGFAKEDWI